MSKLVSQQIGDIQQDIIQTVENGPLPQELTFILGSIYAKLEVAKRTAGEQESVYAGMAQIYLARNPDKLKSLIQNLSEIISGDNTDKEKEDANDG